MKVIYGLFVIAMIAGCTTTSQKPAKEIEASLAAANANVLKGVKDSALITRTIESIDQFAVKFPQDSLTPKFLFESALLLQKEGRYDESVQRLEKIYTDYSQSPQANKALFLEGFLYANVTNQLDKAREKYELYLSKYASVDSKMTNDVQMELHNLGKTPEEILEEIQKKQAQDTTQAS